jgi:hypothetical protein
MQILGSGEKITPEALIPKFEVNRLLKQGKNHLRSRFRFTKHSVPDTVRTVY